MPRRRAEARADVAAHDAALGEHVRRRSSRRPGYGPAVSSGMVEQLASGRSAEPVVSVDPVDSVCEPSAWSTCVARSRGVLHTVPVGAADQPNRPAPANSFSARRRR